MLKDLYTTRMSGEKRVLQNRFSRIRTRSGKRQRLMALGMTAVLLVTFAFSAVVMAAFDGPEQGDIVVTYNGKNMKFSNEPFFYENTVYLPLRELFGELGIPQNDKNRIEWHNGEITIYLDGHEDYYKIEIGSPQIWYDAVADAVNALAIREEPGAPVLKDGITYIPFEYIEYILNRFDHFYDVGYVFGEINSKIPYRGNAEGMTYSDLVRLQYTVDNGHFPWRLDPLEVIRTYGAYATGAEAGEITELFGDGIGISATYVIGGTPYSVELFKPVEQDEHGIWVVRWFEKKDSAGIEM